MEREDIKVNGRIRRSFEGRWAESGRDGTGDDELAALGAADPFPAPGEELFDPSLIVISMEKIPTMSVTLRPYSAGRPVPPAWRPPEAHPRWAPLRPA